MRKAIDCTLTQLTATNQKYGWVYINRGEGGTDSTMEICRQVYLNHFLNTGCTSGLIVSLQCVCYFITVYLYVLWFLLSLCHTFINNITVNYVAIGTSEGYVIFYDFAAEKILFRADQKFAVKDVRLWRHSNLHFSYRLLFLI